MGPLKGKECMQLHVACHMQRMGADVSPRLADLLS
jgi:hypothetical protein